MSALPFKKTSTISFCHQSKLAVLIYHCSSIIKSTMSHALSSPSSISFPLYPSNKTSNFCQFSFSKLPQNSTQLNRCLKCKNSMKAMAGDSRDNLDHLKRASKINSSQPNKKRVAPSAPVGLWDRFPTARTVQQMMETMERIMEDPSAYSGTWPSTLTSDQNGGYRRGRTPWEIKEGEGEYKMRFDMPGMTKDDVKVWVEEKMLVVKAEKAPKKRTNGEEEEEEEGEWSAKSYGRYSSRIALPENVVFDEIKAEVKDGVLYITIPKAKSSARILDINVQ